MINRYIFLSFLLYSVPLSLYAEATLDVGWQKPNENIFISYDKDPELIRECIDTGFEFEKRFLMQACENGDHWFRDCNRVRKQVHQISHDPIRKSYTIVKDLHGDSAPPVTESYSSFLEALEFLKRAEGIPVYHLTKNDPEKQTLLVRVVSSCKGEYSEAIAQLSYFFTLGLVDLGGNDSGWFPFDLKSSHIE